MIFDKDTRNLLARTVTACRRRLTEDVTDQLTGVFGLHPDGTVLALKEMSHLSPDQAAAAAAWIGGNPHLRLVGYHAHLGSLVSDPAPYLRYQVNHVVRKWKGGKRRLRSILGAKVTRRKT